MEFETEEQSKKKTDNKKYHLYKNGTLVCTQDHFTALEGRRPRPGNHCEVNGKPHRIIEIYWTDERNCRVLLA